MFDIIDTSLNIRGIHMIDLLYAQRIFDQYLDQFCREDEKIKLKIVHTQGVIRCAGEISARMGLGAGERELAELIALLHDIGRFEQLKRFDSFEPSVMDHAAYGVELLFGERKMIRDFIKEDTWDHIICEAIARHSSYDIGDGLSPRALFHARMIRDADKLDNCRVKLEDKIEVLLGCSPEVAGSQAISPEIWQECLDRKSIHSEKRRTKMDYWVSYIAYFFDINFPETAKIILDEQYVQKITERIPYGCKDTAQKMEMLCHMAIEWLEKLAMTKRDDI